MQNVTLLYGDADLPDRGVSVDGGGGSPGGGGRDGGGGVGGRGGDVGVGGGGAGGVCGEAGVGGGDAGCGDAGGGVGGRGGDIGVGGGGAGGGCGEAGVGGGDAGCGDAGGGVGGRGGDVGVGGGGAGGGCGEAGVGGGDAGCGDAGGGVGGRSGEVGVGGGGAGGGCGEAGVGGGDAGCGDAGGGGVDVGVDAGLGGVMPPACCTDDFVVASREVTQDVDVVVAIDTSGSMAEEILTLGLSLQTFLVELGVKERGVNLLRPKLIIITDQRVGLDEDGNPFDDIPFDVQSFCSVDGCDADDIHIVPQHVDNHDAWDFLDSCFNDCDGVLNDNDSNYGDLLREGSQLHLVVISDDDADGDTWLAFKARFVADAPVGHGRPDFHFHAVVATGASTCDTESREEEYKTGTADLVNGGQRSDICEVCSLDSEPVCPADSWANTLPADMQVQILEILDREFVLSQAPDEDTIVVFNVDDMAVLERDVDWTYDADTLTVTLIDALPPGTEVLITYEPAGP